MPIDWFTVAAQAVNFLILVALLRHFLYGPIVRAMDQREERIAARLQEAEQEREEAGRQRRQLEQEQAGIDERREEVLREAREQAEQQRQETLREAREEADRRSRAWDLELARHGEDVVEQLLELMGDRLVDGLRTGLEELAGADVQRGAVERFLAELEEAGAAEREEIEAALEASDVRVRLAREPGDQQREELAGALEELGADQDRISFEVDESLIGGVEVRAGGRRVAWSLRRYLEDAEEAMTRFIQETREEAGRDEPEREGSDEEPERRDGDRRDDGERDRAGEERDEREDRDGRTRRDGGGDGDGDGERDQAQGDDGGGRGSDGGGDRGEPDRADEDDGEPDRERDAEASSGTEHHHAR